MQNCKPWASNSSPVHCAIPKAVARFMVICFVLDMVIIVFNWVVITVETSRPQPVLNSSISGSFPLLFISPLAVYDNFASILGGLSRLSGGCGSGVM